ncbi:hypothetical protein DIPPA_05574 [Diplonema papillatum]|nr:hypothetical protein DIPPA_05574 [Diplonema papillatum]
MHVGEESVQRCKPGDARLEQGEALNSKKRARHARKRRKSSGVSLPEIDKAAQRSALKDSTGTLPCSDGSPRDVLFYDERIPKEAPDDGYYSRGLDEALLTADAAKTGKYGSRLTDPAEFVKAQLILSPKPLQPPPCCDFIADEGPLSPCDPKLDKKAGSYFTRRAVLAAQRRDSAADAASVEPDEPASEAPATWGKGTMVSRVTRDSGEDPILVKCYRRPDLDEVSQRVVLASLAEQAKEDEARRQRLSNLRAVTISKLTAQRRARLMMELASGIPVKEPVKQAYGITADPESLHKKSRAAAKARKAHKRDQVQAAIRESTRHRSEAARSHRAVLMQSLTARKSARVACEKTVGTPYLSRSLSSADQAGADRRHRAASSDPDDGCDAFAHLDAFDKRRRENAAIRAVRQRDVPYTLDAPYTHVRQHRAPIVMSDEEKAALKA